MLWCALKIQDINIPASSFPNLPWALLLVIYAPIGLFLTLLRVCMSLQAMLLLTLFPEGTVKR